MRLQLAAIAASIAVASPVAADTPPAAPPSPVSPPEPSDGLTTEIFQDDPPLDLHWRFLNLPERIVELVFAPVGLLVAVVEDKRLDKRVKEIASFWGGRIKLKPRFKLAFGDGLGLGLKLKYKEPTHERTEADIGTIYRLNGDYLVDANLEQPVGTFNDRFVRVAADLEVDQNERYYGLGGGSQDETKRVLQSNHQRAAVSIDLQPSDWFDYSGMAAIGVFRQSLSPGVSPGDIPVGGMDDVAGVPPGFGQTTTYVTGWLSAHYDTRDTIGRPARGLLAEVSADAMLGVDDTNLAGVKLKASAQWFLPILPEARALVLQGGASAALPLYPSANIPLETLSVLGRDAHLRGYDRTRFRDRYAFWGGVEYRFPIYEYLNTDVGLDPFVFVEGGTAFGDDALQTNRLRYSTGGGLRLAHETSLLLEATAGWSPEGLEIFVGGEADL